MLLDTQSGEFLRRFKAASQELTARLSNVDSVVAQTISLVKDRFEGLDVELTRLGKHIGEHLTEIESEAGDARSFADDAMMNADQAVAAIIDVERKVDDLDSSVSDVFALVAQITEHLGLDPLHIFRAKADLRRLSEIISASSDSVSKADDLVLEEIGSFLSRQGPNRLLEMLGAETYRATALEGISLGRPYRKVAEIPSAKSGVAPAGKKMRTPRSKTTK